MTRPAVLALLLAGCGTRLIDPCAHETGACLTIHIDPSANVTTLSQVKVGVSGGVAAFSQTVSLESGAASTELPAAVAVVFKQLTGATPLRLGLDGLLDGSLVGEATVAQTLAPGQHATVHVHLAKGATTPPTDMTARIDMAVAPPDLPGLANPVELTVQLVGSGSGTVSAAGLSCSGATCTGLYAPGTSLTLAAAPAANATFSGWSGGGCVGAGASCDLTLDGSTSVTATFDWKFVPSHVPATALMSNAANLSNVTAIDTHDLTINGLPPAAGITFQTINGIAVLSVAQWSQWSSTELHVTGDAPLAVIASGPVTITGGISVAADGPTPGPGGNAACGIGGGAAGFPYDNAGGGGGDFGGGASGGSSSSTSATTTAGATYGSKVTDFCGGSPGGNGSHKGVNDTTCLSAGLGGGGGGAIQISSAVSITMPNGYINAGGGGGSDICMHTQMSPPPGNSSAYPGGGGSGGLIFLEAPTISVDGQAVGLYANGGGGGGGYDNGGANAVIGNSAALGGGGGGFNGGAGAYSPDGKVLHSATPSSGGGGGGGVGRIWVRTHLLPAAIGPPSSPAPTIDTSL
jgi:hypothetical protein